MKASDGKNLHANTTAEGGTARPAVAPPASAAENLGEEAEGLAERFEEVYTEATTLAESLSDAAHDVNEYVHEQARERPYVALGAAAGLGFVLAGGLTPKVGSLLFTVGGRLLAQRVLREVLGSSVA